MLFSPDGRRVTEKQAISEIESGQIAYILADKHIQELVQKDHFNLMDDEMAAWQEVFKDARKDCTVGNWFGELVAKIDGKWYRAKHLHHVMPYAPWGAINIFSAWVNDRRVTIWYTYSWGALNGSYTWDEATKTATPFTLMIEN